MAGIYYSQELYTLAQWAYEVPVDVIVNDLAVDCVITRQQSLIKPVGFCERPGSNNINQKRLVSVLDGFFPCSSSLKLPFLSAVATKVKDKSVARLGSTHQPLESLLSVYLECH